METSMQYANNECLKSERLNYVSMKM